MSNCSDFRCPSCGDEDHIDIEATIWIRATGDGADAELSQSGGHDFTPDSPTQCEKCDHFGTLREFSPAEVA